MADCFYRIQKSNLKVDCQETARYLGYLKSSPVDEFTGELIQQCGQELLQVATPQAVFQTFDLDLADLSDGKISFADVSFYSKDLSRNLENCRKVTCFAATLGMKPDLLIKKATKLDTIKAAVLQASGAMLIEQFVDSLNEHIKSLAAEQGFSTRPRFSPGYGDVSLEIQKDFFRLLPATKIGLSLMDTLIMSPEKSVTAFVGWKLGEN